jgi:hypothetical protein
MYQKIAAIMNRDYGSVDLSAQDVEDYLRHGDTTFVSEEEQVQIDLLLEMLL